MPKTKRTLNPVFMPGQLVEIVNETEFDGLITKVMGVEKRDRHFFKYCLHIPNRGTFFFHDFELQEVES